MLGIVGVRQGVRQCKGVRQGVGDRQGVGNVNVAQYYVSFYVRLHSYVNAPDDLGPCKQVPLACSTDGQDVAIRIVDK